MNVILDQRMSFGCSFVYREKSPPRPLGSATLKWRLLHLVVTAADDRCAHNKVLARE
jgi:hypothetical protein